MRYPTLLTLLGSALLISGCEKYALDRQMEELCRKDGGVKVFERVTLPPQMFDSTGRLITKIEKAPTSNEPLEEFVGSQYVIETKFSVLKNGNPSSGFFSEGRLIRYQVVIRQLGAEKILGTEISYGRTGGDWTLGHPSQRHCPDPRPSMGVIKTVFIKGY